MILVLFGFYIIREYYLLGLLETSFDIHHQKQFNLFYLAFRQLAVTLDLICSLKFIYWLHYQVRENDLLILGSVWIGSIIFNGIGIHHLQLLEQSQQIY